ncbi:BON domain-containing protein [Caballeronia sp. LP006]|uniref:BON domain-containing protein n=1 Tax=Caballeronia sp. LP006 TaxID=3038552 RepID=UPI002867AE96|nr:BON domain-containing protein [Caballeronia sp. LP006]MDR5827375.1 BON domain-containing protein [Caballeronia sp. LP006]
MVLIRIGVRATAAALACVGMASVCAFAQGGAAKFASPASVTMASAVTGAAASSSKAADRALVRRVLNALEKAKGLRASGITVRANNGAVVLEGWVPETSQVDLATHIAEGVPGVKSVQNTLTLSTF